MKKKLLTLFLITSALYLSACGNAKKENISSDLTELNESIKSTNSDAEDIPFSKFPEYSFDITLHEDGANRAKIISANKIEYNDAYLIDFANNIFDKDSMEICKPYQVSNQSELQAALKKLDETNAAAEKYKHIDSDYYNLAKNALTNYSVENINEMPEGTCIVEYYPNYGSAYTGLFNGKINGTNYAMIYTDMNLDPSVMDYSQEIYEAKYPAPIRIQSLTPSYSYTTTYDKDYSAMDAIYGENLVLEADARKQAEQFLQTIGIQNFVIDDYGKRACQINDSAICYDGYTYIFTRQVDGVKTPMFNRHKILDVNTGDPKNNIPANVMGHGEFIRVDVNSEGVALVDLYIYYEIGDTLTSDFNFISYNEATNMLDLEKNYPFIEPSTTLKTNACFGYLPIKYENKSAYVPVWFFYDTNISVTVSDYNNDQLMKRNELIFAISAVDGTEIRYTGFDVYSAMFNEFIY